MTSPAYFLYHSIGLYPGKDSDMAAALASFAHDWSAPDDSQWPRVLAARAEYLDLWRDWIDAPEGTLTSAENVTTALFSVIGGLPSSCLAGKRVLVAADCFPSLHFLLNGLADRMGFTLHTVPLRPGETWVRDDDMIAAWGPDVGLALLTFVTSTASYRCDLGRLMAHGREQGSLVGLDLTQGVGIVPFSLRETPVDFVISTSLKWLCGTPGAGVIQMRRDLIERTTPELRGWFSQENPFSWDLDRFAYAGDARRFDHGTPSVLACLGSIPALRRKPGMPARKAHNRDLCAAIIEAAGTLGLALASPPDADRRGGSVMLRLPESCEAAALVADLRARAIHVDCRGSILRLSPGEVTTRDHVGALAEALGQLLKRGESA